MVIPPFILNPLINVAGAIASTVALFIIMCGVTTKPTFGPDKTQLIVIFSPLVMGLSIVVAISGHPYFWIVVTLAAASFVVHLINLQKIR